MMRLILLSTITFTLTLGCANQKTQSPTLTPLSYNGYGPGSGGGHGPSRSIAAAKVYPTDGTCMGFPRVALKTAPGFCVGVIDQGNGLRMPRSILALDQDSFLVIDMSAWAEANGRSESSGNFLFYKRTDDAEFTKTVLKAPIFMDQPHGLRLGPDNKIYVSTSGAIYRFNLVAGKITQWETVIAKLPNLGLHPLKSFAFISNGDLIINTGATTNGCEQEVDKEPGKAVCDASEGKEGTAKLRLYRRKGDGSYNLDFQVVAEGLRNSVGLSWNEENKTIVQTENGQEFNVSRNPGIDEANSPPEEINLIPLDGKVKHFGWPYCYANQINTPAFPDFNCKTTEKPRIMLNAHVAPLGIFRYRGSLFPDWYKGKYIAAFHGYRENGHRIAVFENDAGGLPVGPDLNLVEGWAAEDGIALGSPVEFSEMPDGSVLLTEDKNKKVLILGYDKSVAFAKPHAHKPKEADVSPDQLKKLKKALDARLNSDNPPLGAQVQARLFDPVCVQCHSMAMPSGFKIAQYDDLGNETFLSKLAEDGKAWITPGDPSKSELYQRLITTSEERQMPRGGFASESDRQQAVELVEKWINSLK